MSRPMSDGMRGAVAAAILRPALFVRIDFTTGPVYVWSGLGTIGWNAAEWLGVGSLGSVSTIEEGSSVEAKGIAVSLSGIDPTLLTGILSEFQQGLPALVYLGMFDDGGNLIADPILSWAGRTDQPTIEMDGNTATITIACENRLVEMNVPCDLRYTNEQQQRDHPGDRGMEFVSSIFDVMVWWGRAPSSHNNA